MIDRESVVASRCPSTGAVRSKQSKHRCGQQSEDIYKQNIEYTNRTCNNNILTCINSWLKGFWLISGLDIQYSRDREIDTLAALH